VVFFAGTCLWQTSFFSSLSSIDEKKDCAPIKNFFFLKESEGELNDGQLKVTPLMLRYKGVKSLWKGIGPGGPAGLQNLLSP